MNALPSDISLVTPDRLNSWTSAKKRSSKSITPISTTPKVYMIWSGVRSFKKARISMSFLLANPKGNENNQLKKKENMDYMNRKHICKKIQTTLKAVIMILKRKIIKTVMNTTKMWISNNFRITIMLIEEGSEHASTTQENKISFIELG